MSTIPTIEPTIQEPSSPTKISKMNRRDFIKSTGNLLLGSALAYTGLRSIAAHPSPAFAASQGESPPNIILIITDQERYPQHWPEGWAEANLPAHQRLADNALTFNLGNSASENYDNATYVAKRKQLAARLAALEAERLVEQHNIYLPLLQNG